MAPVRRVERHGRRPEGERPSGFRGEDWGVGGSVGLRSKRSRRGATAGGRVRVVVGGGRKEVGRGGGGCARGGERGEGE